MDHFNKGGLSEGDSLGTIDILGTIFDLSAVNLKVKNRVKNVEVIGDCWGHEKDEPSRHIEYAVFGEVWYPFRGEAWGEVEGTEYAFNLRFEAGLKSSAK